MAPRDFSTDGAIGASQGGSTLGAAIPGVTMSDPGPLAAPSRGGGGGGNFGIPSSGSPSPEPGFGGGFGPFASPSRAPSSPGGVPALGNGYGPMTSGKSGGDPGSLGSFGSVSSGGNNWMANDLGMMFAGGGSVPSIPGNQSESGMPPTQPMPGPLPPSSNPFGTRQVRPPGGLEASWKNDLDQAMQTVDAALSYGRKLHGLPSEDPDQQTKQLAQRMPAVPGNQSESGMPVQQPMPGPLPPTSNPFGKRADNDQDQQQPDQSAEAETETPGAAPQQTAGAIPDDDNEETA